MHEQPRDERGRFAATDGLAQWAAKRAGESPGKVLAQAKHVAKPLFSASEVAKLPNAIQQPDKDPAALYEHAKEAFKEQLKVLDEGQGLEKALGATVVRMDKGEKPDLSKRGPVIEIGALKSQARAKEKVDSDYGGDWSRVGDVVRASVAVDSYAQLGQVIDKLKSSGVELARKPKDRFAHPTEAGYRDALLNVRYSNGHVGELQLHLKPILQAKAEGHKLYEKVRTIEAEAKREGRTRMTVAEMATVQQANRASRTLNDRAWKKATSSMPKIRSWSLAWRSS